MSHLKQGVLSQNRSSLSKAITLIESTNKTHRAAATDLISSLLSHRKLHKSPFKNGFRIGLSGAPGVGKSSFIESFGQYILSQDSHRLAVLAIDPSSKKSGGSILGDKTRMPYLSNHLRAYVRPSPSSGSLGGVTRTTSEWYGLPSFQHDLV